MGSVRAEVLLTRKRTATWLLLAIAILLNVLFTYVLPYSSLGGGVDLFGHVRLGEDALGQTSANRLDELLPGQFVASVLQGFPLYVGMLTLMLGVLSFGSEYGWGTLKTTLMYQPNRIRLLAAKLATLAIVALLYTIAVLAVGAVASVVVANIKDAAVAWPPIWEIVRGVGAGWLILALWAFFGGLLAILSKGTAMALGLGIVYGLAIEGILAGFGDNIAVIEQASKAFVRTNTYSLLAPIGVVADGGFGGGGPGAFSGPVVGAWQALVVVVAYLLAFSGLSALVLHRRDVT